MSEGDNSSASQERGTPGHSRFGSSKLTETDIPTDLHPTEADLTAIPTPAPVEVPGNPNSGRKRKPRTRQANRFVQIRNAKGLFLNCYRITGSIDESCANVNRTERTVEEWKRNDENFAKGMDAVKLMWENLKDGSLDNLDLKAIDAVRDALDQKKDMRLRTETAFKVLKAHGLLNEKTITEHTGPGGGPVPVTIRPIRVAGEDDTMRTTAFVEGKSKELPPAAGAPGE